MLDGFIVKGIVLLRFFIAYAPPAAMPNLCFNLCSILKCRFIWWLSTA